MFVFLDTLLFEAPVNFGESQVVALICDHAVNQTVAFIFVTLTQNFLDVEERWKKFVQFCMHKQA